MGRGGGVMELIISVLILLIFILALRLATANRKLALVSAKFEDVVVMLQRHGLGPVPMHNFDRVARSPWWRNWYKV